MATKAKYDLSDGVDSSFTFKIADEENRMLVYEMRYPSQKDFEPSNKIDEKIEKLQREIDSADVSEEYKDGLREEIKKLEKDKAKVFFSLITPIDHKRPIQDLIENINVKVVQKFNKMIEAEMK